MIELAEIHEFTSPQHFAGFRQSLEDAVGAGEVSRVEVQCRYGSLMFEEEWYRFPSGAVWRLVNPDFPFKGVFLRVSA